MEVRDPPPPQSVPPQLGGTGRQCASCSGRRSAAAGTVDCCARHCCAAVHTTATQCSAPVLHRHAIIHQHNRGKQGPRGAQWWLLSATFLGLILCPGWGDPGRGPGAGFGVLCTVCQTCPLRGACGSPNQTPAKLAPPQPYSLRLRTDDKDAESE